MADRDLGTEQHKEEEEKDSSSEEDQEDNDDHEEEQEEFLPEDDDNDSVPSSSSSLKCSAIFLFLMLLSGIVIQLGAAVESWRPPSEAPTRQLEEQEEKEWRASLPAAALQTFYLILAPTISGTDHGRQYEFGWQSREDRHLFTFGALEQRRRLQQPEQQGGCASSGQQPQKPYSTTTTTTALEAASIPIAKAWIETNGQAIFHEIGNFGPMGTALDFYGLGIIKFASVQQQRGKRNHVYHHSRRHCTTTNNNQSPITAKMVEEAEDDEIWYAFEFREMQPGLATLAFVRQLEQEVRTGADSWACGDFGDVTLEIAKQSGFGQLWRDALSSSVTVNNPERVQFRVHLDDPQAYVVSSNGQPLPDPPPRACPQLQHNSLMKQPRLPFW